ncbi:GPI mannosyltransferase 1 [Ascodesmis nigricans]|uniref:GPI mannosyltransferase 1 n=1 Tax=Ascodesmis nigricans TaxID=341454 RepID=A0A4S2N2K1_9PEZI|nr:GPI mannosyltransferase 1 [Ascodesmis nigricans]
MPHLNLPSLLIISAILRIGFLLYGLYQDATSTVKYTDIDYLVFTDAARYLSEGGSPYDRETYRYTPLLAYLLLPTTFPGEWWFHFGKILFAASDIVAGWGIYHILRHRGEAEQKALWYTAGCWLFNPMVATISTRGSSEGLLGVMVILLLWSVTTQRSPILSGFLLGLATHFKIYPIIYTPSILLAMDHDNTTSLHNFIHHFPTPRRIKFALSALATFTALNILFYAIYGYPFLLHTFLHHISRLDHRHNFSPYNILLYLISSPTGASSTPFATYAFIPQILLAGVILPLACAKRDLPGCLFVQTFAFVAFNKVCTSQYFMWYIVLLPFVLPGSRWIGWKGVLGLAVWVAGQAAWLAMGYRLEFLGESVFFPQMWLAALAFFAGNCWLLGEFVGDVVEGNRGGEGKVVVKG